MKLRAFTLVALVGGAGSAQSVPPGFVDSLVRAGWNQTVGVVFAPNGRAFVWEKLKSLVREYDREAIKDRCSRPNKEGKMPSKFEAAAGLRSESFLHEIERAYKRIEESGEIVYRLIFAGIELTPAQSAKVRELFEMHQRTTKGNATDKENATLFLAILPHLTQEQATRAIANVKSLEKGKPPMVKKSTKAQSAQTEK